MRDFDYQRYMASREWAVLRNKVHERVDDGTCERCRGGRTGAHLVVHHLTYERLGHEELEDLQAVCHSCHAWLSGKSNHDPAEGFLRGEADWLESLGKVDQAAQARAEADEWASFTPRLPSLLHFFELKDPTGE